MNRRNFILGLWALLLFIIPALCRGENNPAALESLWSSELNQLIAKMIPADRFFLTVSVKSNKRMERQIVEGESFVQNQGKAQVTVPPLPGFTPNVPTETSNPSQSRQTFRMQEVVDVTGATAFLTVDEKLDNTAVEQVRQAAQSYLQSKQANASVLVTKTFMLQSKKGGINWSEYLVYLPWILLGLAALIFLAWWMRSKANAKQSKVIYPSVFDKEDEKDESERPVTDRTRDLGFYSDDKRISRNVPLAFDERKALPAPKENKDQKQLPEPSKSFPPVPATELFVDRRAVLLKVFLENAPVFRSYYTRLSDGAKAELYAGLRGPAFDNFLESLELGSPSGADLAQPPSEEQLQFYEKNFQEFVTAQVWQSGQFFGFLQSLTPDQIAALIKGKNPLVGAAMLKYMKTEQVGKVLPLLLSSERIEIISQMQRIPQISNEEIYSIESNIRKEVESLPNYIFGSNKVDLNFWASILTSTDEDSTLLMDIEKAYPDMYPSLAKYRFKLEDIPSLPSSLLEKVLDEVENDELAQALHTCGKDVQDYVLSILNHDRKQLLEEQIRMLKGMPPSKTILARNQFTRRIREVMV